MEAAERKLATVLSADLVGSTALGEHQDPERMGALLERFYDAMASEIGRTGGTVEKFAGDAVMAVFGARGARGPRRAGAACGTCDAAPARSRRRG